MRGPDLGAADDRTKGSIVVVGSGDPYDVKLFSGTARSMTLAIERRFGDVAVIRNPRRRGFATFRKIVRRITRGRVDPILWSALARNDARRLKRKIAALRPRAVVSIANSVLTAELGREFPVIHVSDTTFALMVEFYDSFRSLDSRTARAGEAIEQAAIRHAAAVTVSSPWAARSVREHYGKPAEAVHVAAWGCNIPHVGAEAVPPDPAAGGTCRLLFIGLDWTRKGGDIVLDTARRLAAAGFDFQIDIVGARPPDAVDLPQIKVHGLLRKSDPAQNAVLIGLLAEASLLFLPTRQDCTPMVFAEANASGVPAIASDVGGVNGVIAHGENGLLLPADAGGAEFAAAIMRLWADWPAYLALRASSRKAYEERLNWDAWSARLAAVVDGITPPR